MGNILTIPMEQYEAAIKQAGVEAFEEAAKIVEKKGGRIVQERRRIAQDIRALKESTK